MNGPLPPAVELEHVDFAHGDLPVLQDVSLRIGAREFCALIGPNGGGKSTLVKLVLGLLQPGAGRVRVLGRLPRLACTRVGYVPQFAGFQQGFPISAGEVVLQGRLGRRGWWRALGASDRRAALAALAATGVEGLAKRPIGALSGGQLQRVLIARALATEPELLLLDEPTAHIDSQTEHGLFELLAELRQRMAIVVVSHDVGLVSRHVDRIACLNRRLVCHAAAPLAEGSLQALYGVPMSLVHHRYALDPAAAAGAA